MKRMICLVAISGLAIGTAIFGYPHKGSTKSKVEFGQIRTEGKWLNEDEYVWRMPGMQNLMQKASEPGDMEQEARFAAATWNS